MNKKKTLLVSLSHGPDVMKNGANVKILDKCRHVEKERENKKEKRMSISAALFALISDTLRDKGTKWIKHEFSKPKIAEMK